MTADGNIALVERAFGGGRDAADLVAQPRIPDENKGGRGGDHPIRSGIHAGQRG